MNGHVYKEYIPNNISLTEKEYFYFKCINCDNVVYKVSMSETLLLSRHSPHIGYAIKNSSCSELMMISILE